jgi:hypothetical protein
VSAGEKLGGDGCLHPELSGFSPAAGDPQIAGDSAGHFRLYSLSFAMDLCIFAPLRLGVSGRVCFICVYLCDLWASCRGRASCLRVFVFATWVDGRLGVSAPLR